MGIPAADRFLDCVLHRAGKDISISPFVLLLIVPGSLAFVAFVVIRLYIDTGMWFVLSQAGQYLVALFFSMDVGAITYTLMTSFRLHIGRNIEWTNALADYAEEKGKDPSEIREIEQEMGLQRVKWARMLSFIVFASTVAMMVLSFFTLDFRSGEGDNKFVAPEYAALALSLANIFISSLYGLYRVYQIDDIQCRFSTAFTDAMQDDEMPEPMSTVVGQNRLRVQLALLLGALVLAIALEITMRYLDTTNVPVSHVSPLIVFIVIYSTFLFFYVIHILNKHIARQWKYENKLLVWIAAREGATGVARIRIDSSELVAPDSGYITDIVAYYYHSFVRFIKHRSGSR